MSEVPHGLLQLGPDRQGASSISATRSGTEEICGQFEEQWARQFRDVNEKIGSWKEIAETKETKETKKEAATENIIEQRRANLR